MLNYTVAYHILHNSILVSDTINCRITLTCVVILILFNTRGMLKMYKRYKIIQVCQWEKVLRLHSGSNCVNDCKHQYHETHRIWMSFSHIAFIEFRRPFKEYEFIFVSYLRLNTYVHICTSSYSVKCYIMYEILLIYIWYIN